MTVLDLSGLVHETRRLAACCCVFPVGDKRFPDEASLRLSVILEHHSRDDRILPPKATKVSESRGKNREINSAVSHALGPKAKGLRTRQVYHTQRKAYYTA